MKSDRRKTRDWRERSARKYRERVKAEVLAGEREWNSVPEQNPERKKREFERAYGGKARVEWMKRQPSVVSGKVPCVNAHIETDGMGRKADADKVVPLTNEEHMELHRIGRPAFEVRYAISLDDAAREVQRKWSESHD